MTEATIIIKICLVDFCNRKMSIKIRIPSFRKVEPFNEKSFTVSNVNQLCSFCVHLILVVLTLETDNLLIVSPIKFLN